MGAIGAYAMVSEGQIMRPALSLRAVGCSAAASAATLVIRVAQDLEIARDRSRAIQDFL